MKAVSLLLMLMWTTTASVSSALSADGPLLDVSAGIGIPRLIGFDLAVTRLYPVTFGFGFGTIPIENAARRQLNIDPADLVQEVNGYTIVPSFYLDWGSFQTFLRWYPISDRFFIQLLYATWSIKGGASVFITGGELEKSSFHLGAVNLSMVQPMYGLSSGWRWFFGASQIYFELAVGLLNFKKPVYSVSTYTAADRFSSAIPEENWQQISDAKEEIRTQVDAAMDQYHANLKFAPMIAMSLGMVL